MWSCASFFFLKITNAPLWDPSEESPQSDMDGTMEIQTSCGVFHNEVPMPTPPLSNYLLYIPCLSDLLHLPPLCSLSSFHRSTHFLTILPLSSLVSPFSLNKPTSSLTMTSTPSFHSLWFSQVLERLIIFFPFPQFGSAKSCNPRSLLHVSVFSLFFMGLIWCSLQDWKPKCCIWDHGSVIYIVDMICSSSFCFFVFFF